MILNKTLYHHKGYIRGFFFAIKSSIFSLFKNVLGLEKRITIPYPEEKHHYSDRFKGKPYLTVKEDGDMRCVSCRLCVEYCPADCIHIEAENEDNHTKEVTPVSFRIELLRCVFCGFCEEACPVDAIRLGEEYVMADHQEANWVLDQHALANRPTLNGGKGIVSTVDDSDRSSQRL
ncbi:MAG: NADH-quinone oxidoreductase subunit I [Halobacteriovoraceae bacterium]|jgi:NADH-quinone oxidoreductase subunit I|nr:NADH-quinone oxidoreductase subunit I [Halobacteriovoraceae bacterium]MBT5095684.1 NADH-quinone oxidoreductase subunit I [Halobacteriovoraceae bacterium]